MEELVKLEQLVDNAKRQKNMPLQIMQKVNKQLQVLLMDNVDVNQLRQLSFLGISDEVVGLRSIIWRVLMNQLPRDKKQWSDVLDRHLKEYNMYVQEFVDIKPPAEEEKEKDHPLSRKENSKWNNFFNDLELWGEVEKDTTRTRSEMHLFQSIIEEQRYGLLQKSALEQKDRLANQTHCDVITRILFIYAKLNPGIKYIQGMNEIMAVIYYVLANDNNPQFRHRIEADAFHCFLNIMAEVKENFMKQLDNTGIGIKSKMSTFDELLKVVDPELWQHFSNLEINPHFYSLRWIMLLFTQEFSIANCVRLWDSILSLKDNKTIFLYFLSLGVLELQRERLLKGEFEQVMGCLQNIDELNIDQLVGVASKTYTKYSYLFKK